MNIFYENIDAIDQFTMNLHANPTLTCTHCQKQGNLMSHGFVYEEKQHGKKSVGKRIFCSNRHGKEGCGRTIRLYIARIIPSLQYDTNHLLIFITALLSFVSIKDSYKKATQVKDDRNAYRWIRKMWTKLIEYRKYLPHHHSTLKASNFHSMRFQILLPTLCELLSLFTPDQFQSLCQNTFL